MTKFLDALKSIGYPVLFLLGFVLACFMFSKGCIGVSKKIVYLTDTTYVFKDTLKIDVPIPVPEVKYVYIPGPTEVLEKDTIIYQDRIVKQDSLIFVKGDSVVLRDYKGSIKKQNVTINYDVAVYGYLKNFSQDLVFDRDSTVVTVPTTLKPNFTLGGGIGSLGTIRIGASYKTWGLDVQRRWNNQYEFFVTKTITF